jgi:N6-adenosine-specific RNA methylase IME4
MTWEGLSPPYSTIVADPPWSYEDGFVRGTANGLPWTNRHPLPYSAMSVEEIANLDVESIAAPNAFLFLWTTNRYLPAAFGIIDAWGFGYRQALVWHKGDASPFPATVAPNTAEFLLVGGRGNPRRVGTTPSSVVHANRGQHSAKPPAFLDIVERVSPGPYVELFARAPRLGWDSWGYGYETRSAS